MEDILYREGFTASEIPEDIVSFISGVSYKQNTRVRLSGLSYLKVRHYDFHHEIRDGELIVAKKLAAEVLDIFYELYEAGYEIEKVRLVDHYDADDERSMADNNSSAFNYRVVADTDILSAHSFGRAIDINPLFNPYIVGDKVMPANGARYADRTKSFPHKIDKEDICYNVFARHGWRWGGDWRDSKDYQHFYKERKEPLGIAVRKIRHVLGR